MAIYWMLGTHTSDKLAEVDAAVVSELLNEQMANFNRKQLGSESSDPMTGAKRRKKDWYAKGKPYAAENPKKGESKGIGKGKKGAAATSLRDPPRSLLLIQGPSRVDPWMP